MPEPVETAAPTVYVVIERDEWPDSVWWTLGEAETRVAEMQRGHDDYPRWIDICEHRIGEINA